MTKSSYSSSAQPVGRLRTPALAALATALLLFQGPAFAREVQLKVNDLPPISLKPNAGLLQNDLSIAYFANNNVGQNNRRTLQVRLAEPFLCADFSVGVLADRVRLRLQQSNGDIQGSEIRGFAGLQNYNAANDSGGIRYQIDPSNSNLSYLRVSTDTLVCYDFKSTNVPNNNFRDGFESPGQTPGVDLATSIRTPDGQTLSTARPGVQLVYAITVTNNGTSTATGVQVRDYFPKDTNGIPNGAAFNDGTWACTASTDASCGPTMNSNYVFLSDASIPAGASLRIVVSRLLSNVSAGTAFSLQAAAFVAPSAGEIVTTNNAVSVPLVAVTNLPPTIAILSNPSQTRGACPIIVSGSLTCEMSVTLGDDSTLLTSIDVVAVSAAPENLRIRGYRTDVKLPAVRFISYQLAPTFSGQVIVNATATDANGAATTLPITVTVTDPPPTISDVVNITSNEDNGATGDSSAIMVIGPLPVTIGGAGVDVNAAQFEAVSADTSVIPQSAIAVGGSGANRSVTITVPRHAFNAVSASVGAPSNITLTVRNGAASASDNFSIRLIAVNDPPVLRVLAERSFTGPITVLTDSIENWVLEKTVGAANEANPPAGSGVSAQSLLEVDIFNPPQQTTPSILSTSSNFAPKLVGSLLTTLQFRWVASPQQAGAACVFAELTETDVGQGGIRVTPAIGKIRMNGGDISCGAPPSRASAK